jgi:membrane-bound lytic murein transglycosylase D
MSTGRAVVLLASVLSGCLPFGTKAVQPVPEPPPPPAAQVKPPPVPRYLACQHPRVDAWERKLRSRPELREATAQTLTRAEVYLPRLRRIFSKAGLPPSLALLPVIESDFHRTARGRQDDLGLWQFRDATARDLGLVINERHDERLHPYRATRAAVRHLRQLQKHYRSWPLALAAYNAGQRRVDRALAKRPGATFWELADKGHLPATTREYVPRFLAVVRVVEGVELCGSRGHGPRIQTAKDDHRPTPAHP